MLAEPGEHALDRVELVLALAQAVGLVPAKEIQLLMPAPTTAAAKRPLCRVAPQAEK